MDKEKLLQQAKDKRYISGIYNYCDRWCERCEFTSRCLNCTLIEEEFGDLKEVDIQNQEFWQRFENILHHTFEMIKEMAHELGINVDSIEDEHRSNGEVVTQKNKVTGLLVHSAENYMKAVDSWFKSNEHQLYNKEDQLNQIRSLSGNENPDKEFYDIKDAFEVIRWYQYQIFVKLKRASETESEDLSPDDCDFPKDSNGSAKVVLIGIGRSISEWSTLSSYFPDHEREIIDIIMLLENLRRGIELRFPKARVFKRPGFDDR